MGRGFPRPCLLPYQLPPIPRYVFTMAKDMNRIQPSFRYSGGGCVVSTIEEVSTGTSINDD